MAEIKIDSPLAAFLNALTPVSTIIIGALFLRTVFLLKKYWVCFVQEFEFSFNHETRNVENLEPETCLYFKPS